MAREPMPAAASGEAMTEGTGEELVEEKATPLFTVYEDAEGGFTLYPGAGGPGEEAEAPAAEGEEPMAMDAASEGESFASPGALMQGILTFLRENASGNAEKNAEEGFASVAGGSPLMDGGGGAAPPPAAGGMPPRA